MSQTAAILADAPPQPGLRARPALLKRLAGGGVVPGAAGLASDHFAQGRLEFSNFLALCPGGKAFKGASAQMSAACAHASAAGLTSALTIALSVH